MINPQWLELPMSSTDFHDPKDVRAIAVWLHFAKYTYSEVFPKKNNNKKQQLLRNSAIVIEKYMMFSVNNCYNGDLRKAVMLNHIIHENPMNRNSKQLLINQILLFRQTEMTDLYTFSLRKV